MSWRHHRLTIFHGTLRVDITTQAAGPLFSSGWHFYRFLKTCQEWNFFQLGMTVSVFHFSSVFHDTCFLSFIRSTCSTYGCDDSIFFSLYAMEKCLFCQTVNHVEWYGILMFYWIFVCPLAHTQIYICELGCYWFTYWLATYSAPNRHMIILQLLLNSTHFHSRRSGSYQANLVFSIDVPKKRLVYSVKSFWLGLLQNLCQARLRSMCRNFTNWLDP